MNLHTLFLTQNDCYQANRYIKPAGIMVHSTGANNPNLRRYVGPDDGLLGFNQYGNHWNQGGIGKCVHAFIGRLADGSVAVYQTLPWDMRGWHAGGDANNTHISFEICEDALTDAIYFAAVYQVAVELCAMLCKKYGLEPLDDGVLIDHAEGYKRGIASDHGDVAYWFKKHGKSMDTLRRDVATHLTTDDKEDIIMYKTITDIPAWGRPTIDKLLAKGYLTGIDDAGTLDITNDMLRVLVINDRAGLYD